MRSVAKALFSVACMLTLIFLSISTNGCSSGSSSTPNLSEAFLETPPPQIAPSPSDGQPISYAILHPNLIPVVQCPNDPVGPGVIICENPMTTRCVLYSNLQYKTDPANYLGACH